MVEEQKITNILEQIKRQRMEDCIKLPFDFYMSFNITSDGELYFSIETIEKFIFEFCVTHYPFGNDAKLGILGREIRPFKMLFNRQNKNIKHDPFYSGVPNINFSILNEKDDDKDLQNQRLNRGFDDSELWNLDETIASFIYPRLKAYKEFATGFPTIDNRLGQERNYRIWQRILDRMIYGFKLYSTKLDDEENYEVDMVCNKRQRKSFDIALKLFYKYYMALWD